VRAILEGRKTQTRRVIKPQPINVGSLEGDRLILRRDPVFGSWVLAYAGPVVSAMQAAHGWINSAFGECPYGVPGDRLWVRETWRPIISGLKTGGVDYKADDPSASGVGFMPWKPSIHMPRTASRIALEVTEVRAERLADISEADAAAEGVGRIELSPGPVLGEFGGKPMRGHPMTSTHEHAFRELWHTIHASNGPNGWDANPWVWAITFKKCG
jgi:hypothetical protein